MCVGVLAHAQPAKLKLAPSTGHVVATRLLLHSRLALRTISDVSLSKRKCSELFCLIVVSLALRAKMFGLQTLLTDLGVASSALKEGL